MSVSTPVAAFLYLPPPGILFFFFFFNICYTATTVNYRHINYRPSLNGVIITECPGVSVVFNKL